MFRARLCRYTARCIIRVYPLKGVDTSRGLADSAGRYYSRFFLHWNGITHRYAAACARERELFAISICYFECGKKFSAVALYFLNRKSAGTANVENSLYINLKCAYATIFYAGSKEL